MKKVDNSMSSTFSAFNISNLKQYIAYILPPGYRIVLMRDY